MVTQGISETVALEKEQAHNLFMSAENVQGNLLEEYISVSTRPYGWIWCAGNTLRAIDFCSSDGAVLLQIKTNPIQKIARAVIFAKGRRFLSGIA